MIWIFSVVILLIITYYVVGWLLRFPKLDNYSDKYVFITGCDTGFGRDLAIRLDKLGFHVFAGCLTSEGARSLSETCSSKVTTVDLDVTKTESIEAALNVVKKLLPEDTGLWGLVNNAGILGRFIKSEFCSREDFQKVISVNLLGMIDMTNHCLPLIRKARGRIVNASSVNGFLGYALAPYTVSKHGVEGYSDVLRREVSHLGIRVCVTEAGGFRTGIFNRAGVVRDVKEAYGKASPELQTAYVKDYMTMCNRFLDGSDFALNTNTHVVVDAYTHAITAKFPRNRYLLGPDARFLFVPISYLPDFISDPICRWLLEISNMNF